MKPEETSRLEIDQQLAAAGWIVQDRKEMNILAGLGVAVREFPLLTGDADYMLYADAKAIGVVEAKPVGHTLKGVELQSSKYTKGLPPNLPHYHLPLPFGYETTGKVTQFTNSLEPHARSRQIFTFHAPAELIRIATLDDQLRTRLRNMPALDTTRLWSVQTTSIQNLERSLADNRPRALIQMATGSGKTYTAVSFCYRLIKFAGAKRILFLVDRNNLGKQTLNEFQQFTSPYNGYKFTEEYTVQHLKRNTIDPASKVCITTIQRLFSMLQGEPEFLEENEETSLYEAGISPNKKPLPVEYNPAIPIESFDFIVVDECHRSIYNLWRQVLEYFDTFLIGLTATPTTQTIGFFNQNLVQEYTHERAVADGVNVGFDVYRIETEITSNGAKLIKEPGVFVPIRDRRTKKTRYKELDDDLPYTANQLDRDVVATPQIRLVIKTFKDCLPEIFPGRTEVPKTLVFAKTDQHAEDIVEIIRQEFARGNDFCQKITSKSTGAKPDELLQQFRTAFFPRIAVTVDMIATGTDVKPLECLLFMRQVRSLSYFEQMKGRGCRIIDVDALQAVTPDAKGKDHFVIVDAVGVCTEPKCATKPLDRKPSIPLDKLLNQVAAGAADADTVSTLAARLARLETRLTAKQLKEIGKLTDGKNLADLCGGLLQSIDPDEVQQRATEKYQLAAGQEPDEKQSQQAELESARQALRPFHNPKLRETLLAFHRELEQVIDEVTPDKLLRAGFDTQAKEKAASLVTSFKQFLDDHKDEIEALQILYSQPYRAGLRYSHVKELAEVLKRPPLNLSVDRLWQAFQVVEPQRVTGTGSKLVDLIAIVRHALNPDTILSPVGVTIQERYEAWLADQQTAGIAFNQPQRDWLDAIKDHIASSLRMETDDFEGVPFNQLGGLGKAHELFGDRLGSILDELNKRLAA